MAASAAVTPDAPPRDRQPREPVPQIRPFRALRYAPDTVPELARVVAPPYDVVSPEQRVRLVDRDPRNGIRIELPVEERGDQPDDRYRRVARTVAEWRSTGVLHKDPRPAYYVYQQTYRVPGTAVERTQRGFFARLRLEPFGPSSGVLPHERTLSGPKEDRYKLLRATGVNTSPVVGLHADSSGRTAAILAAATASSPVSDVVDDDGVRHQLWLLPADNQPDGPSAELARIIAATPVTIADGHHRYETALRYRDERRMSRSCEEDPPFDYLLMLLLETTAGSLTVLPTHRVVRGLGDEGLARVQAGLASLFEIEAGVPADDLRSAFGAAGLAPGGRGRFGLWSRSGGALLTARREAFEPWLPAGGPALRRLDVSLLAATLEHLAGIDADALAGGDRISYTKSADEAIAWVDGRVDGADLAFLLEPTPVADIMAVAADGDVMPQKSTYFFPKALTGLVINPLEW
jgi:uncharacterized protein (DUF1015 family)